MQQVSVLSEEGDMHFARCKFCGTASVSQLSDFQAIVQTLTKYNYVAARKSAEFKNNQQPYA